MRSIKSEGLRKHGPSLATSPLAAQTDTPTGDSTLPVSKNDHQPTAHDRIASNTADDLLITRLSLEGQQRQTSNRNENSATPSPPFGWLRDPQTPPPIHLSSVTSPNPDISHLLASVIHQS